MLIEYVESVQINVNGVCIISDVNHYLQRWDILLVDGRVVDRPNFLEWIIERLASSHKVKVTPSYNGVLTFETAV